MGRNIKFLDMTTLSHLFAVSLNLHQAKVWFLGMVWHCIYLGAGEQTVETKQHDRLANKFAYECNHDSYKQNPPSLNAFVPNYSLQYDKPAQSLPQKDQ